MRCPGSAESSFNTGSVLQGRHLIRDQHGRHPDRWINLCRQGRIWPYLRVFEAVEGRERLLVPDCRPDSQARQRFDLSPFVGTSWKERSRIRSANAINQQLSAHRRYLVVSGDLVLLKVGGPLQQFSSVMGPKHHPTVKT